MNQIEYFIKANKNIENTNSILHFKRVKNMNSTIYCISKLLIPIKFESSNGVKSQAGKCSFSLQIYLEQGGFPYL